MRTSTYKLRIAEGKCPHCGGRPTPGMLSCESCRAGRNGSKARRVGAGPSRRAKAIKPWKYTKNTAKDSRCRCGYRMVDDIEHACPFAPKPLSRSAVEYMRSGQEADGGNEQGNFWGGRQGRRP